MGGWLKVQEPYDVPFRPGHGSNNNETITNFEHSEFVNTDYIYLLREEKYTRRHKVSERPDRYETNNHHHTLVFTDAGKRIGSDGHGTYVIEGETMDEVLARIRKLNGDPFAECPDLSELHVLNDRGEWTGDETYVPLDYVTKPNTTETFLCMAENKSSSAGVLSNTSFWCPITLPEIGEDD